LFLDLSVNCKYVKDNIGENLGGFGVCDDFLDIKPNWKLNFIKLRTSAA
jgi:hypothetical protein